MEIQQYFNKYDPCDLQKMTQRFIKKGIVVRDGPMLTGSWQIAPEFYHEAQRVFPQGFPKRVVLKENTGPCYVLDKLVWTGQERIKEGHAINGDFTYRLGESSIIAWILPVPEAATSNVYDVIHWAEGFMREAAKKKKTSRI